MDASGQWDDEGVTFFTSSAAVARSVVRLWRAEFGLESEIFREGASPERFGRSRYVVWTGGNRALQARDELRVARSPRTGTDKNAYLCGAFQGVGSLTRPGRGHHLEFVHRDPEFIGRVAVFSRASLKIVRRRGRWVAYTKSADGVTTLLAQMGLHEAVLEYEARAVLGEAKANANRATNFDAANARRTASAAARQQRALAALDPGKLPPALREMLELRLEHPDASLSELARLGGIGKSAANHRLRRLVELAENLSSLPKR
ncbi:MAG: DNA-binding protein WhiA [Rubrobacteraceae bacterium]